MFLVTTWEPWEVSRSDRHPTWSGVYFCEVVWTSQSRSFRSWNLSTKRPDCDYKCYTMHKCRCFCSRQISHPRRNKNIVVADHIYRNSVHMGDIPTPERLKWPKLESTWRHLVTKTDEVWIHVYYFKLSSYLYIFKRCQLYDINYEVGLRDFWREVTMMTKHHSKFIIPKNSVSTATWRRESHTALLTNYRCRYLSKR